MSASDRWAPGAAWQREEPPSPVRPGRAMAELLLRRTFSRLRGKEKLPRKKERELPSRMLDSPMELEPGPGPEPVSHDPDGSCRRGAAITVSRKQSWARFSCGIRDVPCSSYSRKVPASPTASAELQDEGEGVEPGRETDRDPQCPLRPQEQFFPTHTGGPALEDEAWLVESPPAAAPPTPQPGLAPGDEEAESMCRYVELCASGTAVRCASHGAYLQNLEKSSRHWILSSGKAQGPEELAPSASTELKEVGAMGSEGEIWYNPIPEDEDVVGVRQGTEPGSSWRKWGSGTGSRESDRDKARPSRAEPGDEEPPRSIARQVESPSSQNAPTPAGPVGRGEETGAGRTQAYGKLPISCVSAAVGLAGPSPPLSPSVSKKGRSLGRVKSPGTVRRLSLKMKKLPELRRKLSLRSARPRGQEPEGSGSTSPQDARKEPGNVISRYHLDSSVASQQGPHRAKAASKGGYLSDGDSPELLAKADKRACPGPEGHEPGARLDVDAFQPYSSLEQPRCVQPISGLVSVHLHGVGDLKPPKAESREVFCVLQVDAAPKARTALLPWTAAFLSLNHTFNLELEGARHLKVIVFSWDLATCRNRVCCHGTIVLPHIFRGCRAQQLAVRLEPRGLLYCKLMLVEQWDMPSSPSDREPRVFGVELRHLVERENTATKVPLLIQKCVSQIEKRGLKIVGLYRLCGSAAVKKELRDAFERDSAAVMLSEQLYPDINVITGILKDYLRELPTPLITKTLYQVVLEAMAQRQPQDMLSRQNAKETVALLDCLPEIEKATLTVLLDHLSLVASFHDFNRMNSQNIAVCFGPVLLNQNQEPWRQRARSYAHCEEISSAVDFKRHIEVLHYLLQAWPAPYRKGRGVEGRERAQSSCLRQRRRPALRLDLLGSEVVARHRPRGLESPPTNRYAGEWSVCSQEYGLVAGPGHEVNYTEVAGSDSENEVLDLREGLGGPSQTVFVGDFALVDDPEAPFSPRLNLKDFDALILDLERELSKQINVCL
ncbi:rho GTPase-activating protein SYDE1 isoform X2 [Mauremys reevesii]|uniref:rho GTPase-activating protein SYDE1 isoform X2 n=1 Tax=Mauremys reevesii TaxID=260615 RepID=UPI00193FE7AB|nr:rho GTPase-activating protein SYDE1 isoform X2 [Mauremys reevesii]